MHRGWAKIHRCIFDNHYWKEKPFTRGQSWVDIILLANHQDGQIRKRGVIVQVKRGQLGHSQNTLADRWGWSRGKVIRFLNELESTQQIVQQKTNVTSLITVVNYEMYQASSTADSTASSTANSLQTVPEQELKKVKNGKEEKTPRFNARLFLSERKVDKQHTTDFLLNRKTKRLSNTLTAFTAIEREAGKANLELPAAIEKCCSEGWGGFKASWLNGTGQRGNASEDRQLKRELALMGGAK